MLHERQPDKLTYLATAEWLQIQKRLANIEKLTVKRQQEREQ